MPRIIHPLTHLRNQENNTQQDLATHTGLTLWTISRLERGVQIPTYFEAKALENHYGIKWHRITEACIDFQQQLEKHNSLWKKISEDSSGSHVCINAQCAKEAYQ
jgi:transcriptional regulator with XRE-family HTH domain